ncbi:MAG: hypothetical protein JXB48_18080 [Candidatus Latescibacteria bacterium]|nr:hypothetical protein [Candidatus Latescibacterota bacterium]
MIHKLCKACINTCKQTAHAKIVRCPNFQRRLTDNEFRNLIDELDVMEKEADNLRNRVHNLINQALDHKKLISEEESDPEIFEDDETEYGED